MDCNLLIFITDKELSAVEVNEQGETENISFDGNITLSLEEENVYEKFVQYLCDTYNIEKLSELAISATMIHAQTGEENVKHLSKQLEECEEVNCISLNMVLPMVLAQQGMAKGNSGLCKCMGSSYQYFCGEDGSVSIFRVDKKKVDLEISTKDFGFLYHPQSGAGGSAGEIEEAKKAEEEAKASLEACEEKLKELEEEKQNLEAELAETKELLAKEELIKEEKAQKISEEEKERLFFNINCVNHVEKNDWVYWLGDVEEEGLNDVTETNSDDKEKQGEEKETQGEEKKRQVIWKVKKDGSEKQAITTETRSIDCLLAVDDRWIYYAICDNPNNDAKKNYGYHFYRMSIYGEYIKEIFLNHSAGEFDEFSFWDKNEYDSRYHFFEVIEGKAVLGTILTEYTKRDVITAAFSHPRWQAIFKNSQKKEKKENK